MFENILPYERSYWIIPGKFLAGNIPVELDTVNTYNRIENLLDVGIRCFISLIQNNELTSYGIPIINYNNTLQNISAKKKIQTSLHEFPIVDMGVPSVKEMEHILYLIDDCINNDKPVYVHCWGGIGRTGTVVGCYLISKGMANKKNVLEMLKYLRRTEPYNDYIAPQSEQQINMVLEWKKAQ